MGENKILTGSSKKEMEYEKSCSSREIMEYGWPFLNNYFFREKSLEPDLIAELGTKKQAMAWAKCNIHKTILGKHSLKPVY